MAQLTVRIDEELKTRLDTLARQEGKSTSDVVRTLLREYVQNRDRSAFLDHLWDRMQERAEASGLTREDVERIITEVREVPSETTSR